MYLCVLGPLSSVLAWIGRAAGVGKANIDWLTACRHSATS